LFFARLLQNAFKVGIMLLCAVLLLGSCTSTRYLGKDEYLLHKQKISKVKKVDEDNLDNFYQQEPNSRIAILPISIYVWLYEKGKKRYDPKAYQVKIDTLNQQLDRLEFAAQNGKQQQKRIRRTKRKIDKYKKKLDEGTLFMRWGEPLAVFDSGAMQKTTQQMTNYLFSQGLFLGQVQASVAYKRRKAIVTYNVTEGPLYLIDSLALKVPDKRIESLLQASAKQSLFKKGQRYDQSLISRERERIDGLLRNQGYYEFSRSYILFNVDTSYLGQHRVFVQTEVLNPEQQNGHRVFKIDSVVFTTDAGLGIPESARSTKSYKGIDFRALEHRFSQEILSQRIFIRKDSLYQRDATVNTQRQLTNLDIFKFVRLRYDTLPDARLVANIFSNALPRYQTSSEVGINVTQGLPGPFLNASIKNRNTFGGLEILELSGRIGYEGVAAFTDVSQVYQSIEAGANLALSLPQFVLPVGENLLARLGKVNPKTRVQFGYNLTDRPEYRRTSFSGALNYIWQSEKNYQYNFTLTDLSLIRSDITDDSFQDILDEFQANGNNLINSFQTSFVTSTSFSAAFRKQKPNTNQQLGYLRLYGETGGTMLNILGTGLLRQQNLAYFKYVKAQVDWRRYTTLGEKTTLAFRINVGAARPYGETNTLPYEKFFFAGGSNSIRAWRPRRLGPGSFTPAQNENPEQDGTFNYQFEQPGEILLESSLELRRNLLGFINGALFIDVGNTWTFLEDVNRPGSRFEINDFYRELAVGTGFGLRFDFSFLILRADWGIKVYDPARAEGQRWLFDKLTLRRPLGEPEQTILNIGIGYPF